MNSTTVLSTAATTAPIRVIVFASEQLFPTLAFLLHIADQYKAALQSIHIYCTGDEVRSKAPALRLGGRMQAWCKQHSSNFTVHINKTGTSHPVDVRKELEILFTKNPDAQWFINVTGGTKPMSAAAIEYSLKKISLNKRVIYADFVNWFEIRNDEQGFLNLFEIQDRIVPPVNTLDKLIDLEDLIRTQFSKDHIVTTQKVEKFNVRQGFDGIVKAGRGRWKAGLEASVGIKSPSDGIAFEFFVGAGLQDSGLGLCNSLKLHDSKRPDLTAREVDLVGCHHGRLFCIDIKTSNDTAKGTQLADISDVARQLGGSQALAIALRPVWEENDEVKRLAKALNVKLITKGDAPELFTILLGWIDKSLIPSSAVQETEELMGRLYEKRLLAFSSKL